MACSTHRGAQIRRRVEIANPVGGQARDLPGRAASGRRRRATSPIGESVRRPTVSRRPAPSLTPPNDIPRLAAATQSTSSRRAAVRCLCQLIGEHLHHDEYVDSGSTSPRISRVTRLAGGPLRIPAPQRSASASSAGRVILSWARIERAVGEAVGEASKVVFSAPYAACSVVGGVSPPWSAWRLLVPAIFRCPPCLAALGEAEVAVEPSAMANRDH